MLFAYNYYSFYPNSLNTAFKNKQKLEFILLLLQYSSFYNRVGLVYTSENKEMYYLLLTNVFNCKDTYSVKF